MHDVFRIIDANLNRAGEGLRTIEEFARMSLNDATLTEQLKKLRHDLAVASGGFDRTGLLSARDTIGDVGTVITNASEQNRGTSSDVASAACRRVAEALRSIEEYGKIVSPGAAAACERIRYRLYTIEQQAILSSPRRGKLSRVVLHVLVTESLCRRSWFETCTEVIASTQARGSMGSPRVAIQLREKDLRDRELLERARRLRDLTTAADVLLIINDRADVARVCGADGVHLGQDDLGVAAARSIVGPTMLIGKSTHNIEHVRSADKEAVDYIAVGPMFASKTKWTEGIAGPALLNAALIEVSKPTVAIGGITPENIASLKGKGSFAIAASHAIIGSEDPKRAVEQLVDAMIAEQAA